MHFHQAILTFYLKLFRKLQQHSLTSATKTKISEDLMFKTFSTLAHEELHYYGSI